jgi:two-component system sensor histidine kinase FlrB
VFQQAQSDAGEMTLQDGRTLNLAQRLLDPGAGRVLLFTDVTEHRKVQQLLARHRRLAAMGEMAAALAHQLRTPLSAALLYTSNATRAELSDERRQQQLDKATSCLQNLEQLIADMLQFARGAATTEETVTVRDLFDSVNTALQPSLGNHQQLKLDSGPAALELTGNREALAGALLNLANNALQHAGANARVEISARRNGTDIELYVRDNGPGVPAEFSQRVFEPFFTSRPDGTGLGLAVVRSVAQAHRGSVSLDESSDAGCCFVMRLPAKTAAAVTDTPVTDSKLEDAAA